jgi:hypothetical protein
MRNPIIDEAPITINRRDELIDALWAGDIGEVEFAELGIELGMEAHELAQVMSDVREEDGTL